MTQKPYDKFAKLYLKELLSPFGEVETTREVHDEVRFVDVEFIPLPSPVAEFQNLGLLSKILQTSCLLEVFSHQPTKTEVRNCILKLFLVFGELQRQSRREMTSLAENDLPRLWILAASASAKFLSSFGANVAPKGWLKGVYFLDDSFRTAIVAINQLPTTPETLLVRILGRGKTLSSAVDELLQLPETSSMRQNVQRFVSNWRLMALESSNSLTEDDRELIMGLSKVYLDWEEKTRQQGRLEGQLEGRLEGRLEGQRLILENLLKVRFGSVDDELAQIIEPMLELAPEEYTPLVLQLSREQLLARFKTL
jgi:hypothetical protein